MSRWGEQAAEAVVAHLGGGDVEHTESRDWASATFVGQRHGITVRIDGDSRRALSALAEAELPLERGFVADLSIGGSRYDGCATFASIDLLTIDA